MAKTRLKFIWGANEQLPGEWRLGLWGTYERDPGSRIRGRAVSLRGLLAWGAGGVLALYLGLATALYAWFERQPFNLITYGDTLMLPLRWSQVRELRGRMMIEAGLADLRARKWFEGQMKLRLGLIRAPDDQRARVALAQFYILANRRPSALAVLEQELTLGYPGRSYLATLFAVARQNDNENAIVEACDRFLPAVKQDREWLLMEKTQALIAGGRDAEAVKLVEAEGAGAGTMLKEAKVMALLDTGRAAEAVEFLASWQKAPGANRDEVLRLQVRVYREVRRFREMDEAFEALRADAPANPRTYVYGVVQKWLAGREADARAALEDYFLRFAGSRRELELVTAALAEAKAPALVSRCVDVAAEHGFPPKPFKMELLEVQLAEGDWAGATATLAELQALSRQAGPVERRVLLWMTRMLAVTSQTDAAPPAALLEVLQQAPTPLNIYVQTVDVLLRAKRYGAARSVWQLADGLYPGSYKLAGLRRRLDAAMPVAVAMPVAPVVAPGKVVTERAFFERLEASAREERWAEVEEAIREINASSPAWLDRRGADVLDWQMRAAGHTGDTAALVGAARLYLNGSNERGLRVVARARDLANGGDRSDAEFLLAEVLRDMPQFPPAVRLNQEWHPPPNAKTEPAKKK